MKILVVVATVLAVLPTWANTEIKVMGGAGSIKTIQTKQQAIESKLKVKVSYAEGTSEKGVTAVTKGFVDIASLAESPDVTTKRLLENNSISGVKVDDFAWIKYTEQDIHLTVNDKNNVSSLTDDQVTGILTGKIKNWSEIGGPNVAVKPCMTKATFISNKAIFATYNGGNTSDVVQYVVDQTGINNMVKSEPGTACFSSTKSLEGAKQILLKAKIPSYFFYKKDAPKVVKDFVTIYMAN